MISATKLIAILIVCSVCINMSQGFWLGGPRLWALNAWNPWMWNGLGWWNPGFYFRRSLEDIESAAFNGTADALFGSELNVTNSTSL
jgi:hypothetical protein